MVCAHRPIFDTAQMLAHHRQGKKHAQCKCHCRFVVKLKSSFLMPRLQTFLLFTRNKGKNRGLCSKCNFLTSTCHRSISLVLLVAEALADSKLEIENVKQKRRHEQYTQGTEVTAKKKPFCFLLSVPCLLSSRNRKGPSDFHTFSDWPHVRGERAKFTHASRCSMKNRSSCQV